MRNPRAKTVAVDRRSDLAGAPGSARAASVWAVVAIVAGAAVAALGVAVFVQSMSPSDLPALDVLAALWRSRHE